MKVFVSSLGDYVPVIKTDKKGQLFKSVRRMLSTASCVRLYGLLTHFCYWNIIHPAARSAMKDVILASDNNLLLQHSHHSSVHSFSTPSSVRTSSIHTPPRAFTPPATRVRSHESYSNRGQTPPPPTSSSSSGFISLGSSHNSNRHCVAVSYSDAIEADDATVVQQRVNLPDVLNLSSTERNKQLKEVATFINENMERNKLLAAGLTTANVTVETIFDASTEDYMNENKKNSDINAVHDYVTANQSKYDLMIIDEPNSTDSVSVRKKDERAIRFASDFEFEGSRLSNISSRANSHNGDLLFNGGGDADVMDGNNNNLEDVYDSKIKTIAANPAVVDHSVTSEASLSNNEKEQLFLQLEYCLVKVFQVFGNRKMFLVAGRQVNFFSLPFLILS